jgi:hypothetical protein
MAHGSGDEVLGNQTMANSESVTIASDDVILLATNTKLDTLHTDLGTLNTTEGGTADVKVTGDTAGSHSAKLRGLNYLLNLVVDITNTLLHTNIKMVGGTTVAVNSGTNSAGTQRVTVATDDALNTVLGATGDAAVTAGATGSISAKLRSISRDLIANIVLAAGSNLIGVVNIAGRATGGVTPFNKISAATTNATNVKASAATLKWLSLGNVNVAARFFKVYDKASSPTVGTDTPVLVFMIPGNTAGAGREVSFPVEGILLSNGLSYAITTGVANSDTGAVAANEVTVNGGYF